MKKIKCIKTGWYILSSVFLIFGIMHLLGIPIWKKFEGWQEPNTVTGIIYLTIAFGIYKAVNYFCKTPATLKCISCKKVFNELLTKDNKCPDCKGKLIDVNEYYKEPSKNQ